MLKNIQKQIFDKYFDIEQEYMQEYIIFTINTEYEVHNDIQENTIGYIIYKDSIDVIELIEIGILPTYQKNGYAKKLLEQTLKYDKPIFLEVAENNIKAINLYKKYDFKNISVRKKYYNNIDAIIMKKDRID